MCGCIFYMLDTKQDEVSLEDLIDQFVNFYFAGIHCLILKIYYNFWMITGQETTATLLSFTLIQLLLHPDLLNRYILVTIITCAFTINEYLYFFFY